MLDLFVITLWLEFKGKLYVKYDFPLRSNCERAYKEIKEQYKKASIKIIAMNCEPTKGFVFDKEIMKYTKSFKENLNPKKELLLRKK
jgi:hypothetical protein